MSDIKDNKFVHFSEFDIAQCSQFKEFNYEQEKTPIQTRLYYLMVYGYEPRGKNESLYGWAARLGLSKSTVFGIFAKGNQNMHASVAEIIAKTTGANPIWIQKGVGEPFIRDTPLYKDLEKQIIKPLKVEDLDTFQKDGEINSKVLEKCFEATDGALYDTFRMMDADDKAEFIWKFYTALIEESGLTITVDSETFIIAVFTIELLEYYSRQKMSPSSKTILITDIYGSYDSNAEMKQSALDEYLEYKRKK